MTDAIVRPALSGDETESRGIWRSVRRGFLCRCPNCGRGHVFRKYIKSVAACSACGEDLSHHRADDAPPYITIVLVGHITVPLMVAMLMETNLSNTAYLAIWMPVAALTTLALLQPVKGAVIGLQWALRMHGFGGEADQAAGSLRQAGHWPD